MKKLEEITKQFGHLLQGLLILAMAILGIILIFALFRELVPLVQEVISGSITSSNNKILDEVIVFFLLFEFTAMTISALMHHGHTSINFLLGLGVTALTRNLLTAHGNIEDILINSVSILLLAISMVVYNKHFKDDI
ncbi:phosphate-starvation-inducible protein PsiE [Lactobacillus hamsteri]|uniref:Protein PsiE n=1 Tax=Lactobacillus hamsteri DSM 5661 = JCM 6256 TaxID=1423754 RepID=A0A0R1YKN8_9LACO|nr:phosphate-starvation-inducible protein PsiE [Lactobacillus hamsteri]KRM40246.1 phosphate-starvation-inducible protein PsiE [Lactobacillus hamsteri DSM 5661 = JCM 6256]